MNPLYITQQGQLETLCQSLSENKPKVISVDTEFIRQTTYWPKLCLIQLGFRDQIVLIDPLPEALDLSPLKSMFLDNEILKIFHAARQDLEVLYVLWNDVPQTIADTQILAMVCGFGDSISYDKLSEAIAGQKIDKSQQHTDWAQRPLSPKQMAYAMGDVQWLGLIYDKLCLQAGNKIEYIREELDFLKSPELYKPAPDKAWLKIKTHTHHKPEVLGVLKEIAAVRERYAEQQNRPRSHVIKDEVLVQIATKNAVSEKDLASFGIKDNDLQNDLLSAIQAAIPLRQINFKSKQNTPLVDILIILLKIMADQHGIASKLIGNREKLEIFLENPQHSPLMQGWRLDLFGDTAFKIKEGTIALACDPKPHQPVFTTLKS